MNILIIDDMTVPEKNSADSDGKKTLFRLREENLCRRLFLAREFSNSGANVLLARMDFSSGEKEFPFDYRESGGISQIFVPVKKRKNSSPLFFGEMMDFSAALADNAKSLSGLFKPDVIICGGVLPFYSGAAAKIAKSAGAVLITELCCSPAQLLRRCKICSGINPVLMLLKKASKTVFYESDGVIGLFPAFENSFPDAHRAFSMEYSAFAKNFLPSDEAKQKQSVLKAFKAGETFVLACPDPLENGFSTAELMEASSAFGKKFALVFTGEGKRKAAFKKLCAEKGYTNIYFMDEVSLDEEAFVLSAADGIFLSENSPEKGFASDSLRYFSAFGAGRPIIASAENSSDIFRRSGGSIITKPKNKESIRLGIKALLELSENEKNILGRANRDFAEKNSAEKFAADYFSLIDNLLRQKEIKK